MPETIAKTDDRQIIGGVFSDRKNADQAVKDLRELGIADENIQVVVTLDDKQVKNAYRDALVGRGFAESQALFYENALQNGKTLVAVHNVVDPAPVIEALDDNKAEYNPDGSRNVRQDVFGLTAGAISGAAAGGAAGSALGGPVGAVVGIATGTLVGAGAGAAAGKAVEHQK